MIIVLVMLLLCFTDHTLYNKWLVLCDPNDSMAPATVSNNNNNIFIISR